MLAYARYFQRVCLLKAALFERDVDLMIITGAIGLAGIEHKIRDPDFRSRFASIDAVLGLDGQRGTNAMSIADTTGLPRETVRRKIKRLIEMGIVARRESGDYVLQPGALQSAPFVRAIFEIFEETVRMINECIENEILTVLPPAD